MHDSPQFRTEVEHNSARDYSGLTNFPVDSHYSDIREGFSSNGKSTGYSFDAHVGQYCGSWPQRNDLVSGSEAVGSPFPCQHAARCFQLQRLWTTQGSDSLQPAIPLSCTEGSRDGISDHVMLASRDGYHACFRKIASLAADACRAHRKLYHRLPLWHPGCYPQREGFLRCFALWSRIRE